MKHLIISLSNGTAIPIDESELDYVLEKMALGKYVICKQGVFNPSYFVSITEDQIRKGGYKRDLGRDIFVSTSKEPLADMFPELREKMLALAQAGRVPSKLPGAGAELTGMNMSARII